MTTSTPCTPSLESWLEADPTAALADLDRERARRSPVGFAALAGRGRWHHARHLDLIGSVLRGIAPGSARRLVIAVPPRHGKSTLTSQYFPAWFLGRHPDARVILTSYEADFAASWGRKVRDALEEFGGLFGVSVRRDSSAANRWDVEGRAGGMVTAGVGGPITGRGADLLVIDDPVKNAEEAASPTYREKAWDWYISTAYTRLEPGGSVVVIQTRWHEDDLAGRILDRAESTGERWERLILPALAEDDDPLGREPGEALWPERYDAAELESIRATIGPAWFASLYQQRPSPSEGGLFKRPGPAVIDAAPADLIARVRAWDKAGTEGGDGAYSAGVLMGRTPEGLYVVLDVIRGRWSALQREQVIKQAAELDGRRTAIWVEQEPGSGGKESAEATIRNLAGWDAHAERVTGDKESRARPFAAQWEAGNVRMVRATWNREYVEELLMFPNGKHLDMCDASSMAFNKLAIPGGYRPSAARPARIPDVSLPGYRGGGRAGRIY